MSIKTIDELREFLAIEMERLKNGDTTPANANASANLSGKILSSVKMELEYNRMIGATPIISFLDSESKQKKIGKV